MMANIDTPPKLMTQQAILNTSSQSTQSKKRPRTIEEKNGQTRIRMTNMRARKKALQLERENVLSDLVSNFIQPSAGCRRMCQYQPLMVNTLCERVFYFEVDQVFCYCISSHFCW